MHNAQFGTGFVIVVSMTGTTLQEKYKKLLSHLLKETKAIFMVVSEEDKTSTHAINVKYYYNSLNLLTHLFYLSLLVTILCANRTQLEINFQL